MLLAICILFLSFLHYLCVPSIDSLSAASGFSFNKEINLADESQSIDIGTFHLTLEFSGILKINGSCDYTPSFSSKKVNKNEEVPLELTLNSSPLSVSLTLIISVNGEELSKTLTSTPSSLFDDNLDFGNVSIPLGTVGNPKITIHANMAMSNNTVSSKIVTEGPIKTNITEIAFNSNSSKSILLSSTGEGDSKISLSDANLHLGIEAVAITGEGSVDVPLLGTQQISLGKINLPVKTSVDIEGTPDKFQIVALSTSSLPKSPSGTIGGKGFYSINKKVLLIILVGLIGAITLTLIIVLSSSQNKPRIPVRIIPVAYLQTSNSVIPLDQSKGSLRIGRSPDNDIVCRDQYTSHHHAELKYVNGGWCIKDLDSKNGTYVDGIRIKELVALKNEQKIKIGNEHMRFIIMQKGEKNDK